jgi:hypothetical protein
VFRRVLLAALLCLCASASVDHLLARSPDAAMRAASTAFALQDDPGPDRSDSQWLAERPASAALTESVWKSPLHHAELAGARCLHSADAIGRRDIPVRHPSHAPPHLLHVPLLI